MGGWGGLTSHDFCSDGWVEISPPFLPWSCVYFFRKFHRDRSPQIGGLGGEYRNSPQMPGKFPLRNYSTTIYNLARFFFLNGKKTVGSKSLYLKYGIPRAFRLCGRFPGGTPKKFAEKWSTPGSFTRVLKSSKRWNLTGQSWCF